MDIKLFKKIIDEIKPYDPILLLHRRGESMLHPQFNEMLEYLDNSFSEVQMATNITHLTKDKYKSIVNNLTFLSFSLDTKNSFNRTRIPAKYEIVEKKILDFLAFNNSKIKTQVSMVNAGQPQNEIDEFVNFWSSKVSRVRVYEAHSSDGEFGKLNNPREIRQPCVMPTYQVTIYDNGIVARCNHDWDSDGMGDLNKNTLKEIFNNQKYKNLREQHKNLQITDKICKGCDSWYPEIGNQGTGKVVE
jgi:radical SAM protein with 4Fe4S-binding SPASM domain